MIDLSKLAVSCSAKVDDQAAAQNCLQIYHFANHGAAVAKRDFLSDSRLFGGVLQIVQCHSFQTFSSTFKVGLLPEDNFESSVVYSFEHFDELSHRAEDFSSIVLGAVHILKQAQVDCDLIAKGANDIDFILQNLLDAVVGYFGKVLANVQLFPVPIGLANLFCLFNRF